MSLYRTGLAAPTKGFVRVGDFRIWRGIATPGTILDEIKRVDGLVNTTGADIMGQLERRGRPEDLKAFAVSAWIPFITRWKAFVGEHRGWTDRLWGNVWDHTQDYLKQLKAIRVAAKNVGFDLVSPEPQVSEVGQNPIGDPIGEVWGMVKVILWAILIGGGVWLLFHGVSVLRAPGTTMALRA